MAMGLTAHAVRLLIEDALRACTCDCHTIAETRVLPAVFDDSTTTIEITGPRPYDDPCIRCVGDHLLIIEAVHAVDSRTPPAVSSAILEPDPDKGTTMPTMTDATFATDGPPMLIRADRNETITGRSAAEVSTLLDRAAAAPATAGFVQKARKAEATGTLGLYLEAVMFTGSGKPFTHMKFFVIDCHVYVYNRSAGDSRANWRQRDVASLDEALKVVQATIDKPQVKIFGHPVLVELSADDLSAVEAGQMPPGRFRGQYRIERDFGRFDFEMDVVSAPIPKALVSGAPQAVRHPHHRPPLRVTWYTDRTRPKDPDHETSHPSAAPDQFRPEAGRPVR